MKGAEEPLEICEVGEEGEAPLTPPADSEKVRRVFTGATAMLRGRQGRSGSHTV